MTNHELTSLLVSVEGNTEVFITTPDGKTFTIEVTLDFYTKQNGINKPFIILRPKLAHIPGVPCTSLQRMQDAEQREMSEDACLGTRKPFGTL